MRSRNILLLIVFIIAGLVLGGLLASATQKVPSLAWLSYSKSFGISPDSPLVLDFSALKLSFGLLLDISVAQVVGVIAALLAYRRFK